MTARYEGTQNCIKYASFSRLPRHTVVLNRIIQTIVVFAFPIDDGSVIRRLGALE